MFETFNSYLLKFRRKCVLHLHLVETRAILQNWKHSPTIWKAQYIKWLPLGHSLSWYRALVAGIMSTSRAPCFAKEENVHDRKGIAVTYPGNHC